MWKLHRYYGKEVLLGSAISLLVLTAVVTIFVLVFLVVNLLVDLLYGFLDPRIRYE